MDAEDCKHTPKKQKVRLGTHGECILSTCCTNDLHLQSKTMHGLYAIELYTSKSPMVNRMLWPFYDIHACMLHTWGFIAAGFLFASFCFEIGFHICCSRFWITNHLASIFWVPGAAGSLCTVVLKMLPNIQLGALPESELVFFFFLQEPGLGFLHIFAIHMMNEKEINSSQTVGREM